MFGPDVLASVTTGELRQLVDGVRFIERMRAQPVDKDASARETAPLRRLFTRSVVARRAAAGGHRARARRTWRSRSRAPACRPTASTSVVGQRAARAPSTADQLLAGRRHRRASYLDDDSCQTENLRRRHRAAQLLPHPDRAAGHPAASRPRAAARRRRLGAARSLRQRHSGDRARRLRDRRARLHGARGREPRHLRQVHRPRPVGAGDGVRQPQARRRGHGRRPLRDARHRRRRRRT